MRVGNGAYKPACCKCNACQPLARQSNLRLLDLSHIVKMVARYVCGRYVYVYMCCVRVCVEGCQCSEGVGE